MKDRQEEIFFLNNEQKKMIMEGKRQISRGDFVSNEELEREEDQWLNGLPGC